MKDKKSYYAVIPGDVRYAQIPGNVKLLYGEISALCNERGYCWASNQYFAELYEVHKDTISKWVKILTDHGFIRYEVVNKNERKIWLSHAPSVEGDSTKEQGGVAPKSKGDSTNVRHNTTGNTTVNNTEKEEPSLTPGEFAKRFFEQAIEWREACGDPGYLMGDQLLEVAKSMVEKWGKARSKKELASFTDYWTEPTPSGKKMLWQTKPTFDVKRRINTWMSKHYE